MAFESFAELLAMGGHGAYVWSAYGVALGILVWNIYLPLRVRRQFLRQQARLARRGGEMQ